MTASSNLDRETLFQRYLAVCNQAIEVNKDRFPFNHILGTVQKKDLAQRIEVCIIDDRPEAEFILNLKDDKMKAEKPVSCASCSCDRKWRVKKSYLESVISNPQTYIDNRFSQRRSCFPSTRQQL